MPVLACFVFIWLISSCANLIVMTWFTYHNIDVIERHLSGCKALLPPGNYGKKASEI
jgi:hypothetical protein